MPQLQKLASRSGLTEYSRLNKCDLINKLRAHFKITEQFCVQTFDYKTWAKPDLRNRCKDLGIKNYSNMSNKKMIKTIDKAELTPVQLCPNIHTGYEEPKENYIGGGISTVQFKFGPRHLNKDQFQTIMTAILPHLK